MDDTMTDEQRAVLRSLSRSARVPFDGSLNRDAAARRIEELKARVRTTLAESAAGEEDPGAALGDDEERQAMQRESAIAQAKDGRR
jgi:DUF3072 family protein